MARRRKERFHLTGKSNRNELYLSECEQLSENTKCRILDSNPKNAKVEKHGLSENKNNFENSSEEPIKIQIAKSHPSENAKSLLDNGKTEFHEREQSSKRLSKFHVEKHEKTVNDVSRLVKLNKNKISQKNDYSKGSPCVFKPGGVKRVDIKRAYADETKIEKGKEKEIDSSGLWDYLHAVKHSEDNRLHDNLKDILNKRNKKMIWSDEKREENISSVGIPKESSISTKKENINFKEYEDFVKYVLPSASGTKIKHSWEVLKNSVNSEEDTVSCDDLFRFIDTQGKTNSISSDYTCKIVSSRLQKKALKYNYNPDDVHLKTINYVDTIRCKASEFSQNFKELVTEDELKSIFKEKEKISKKELEQCISHIVKEKIQMKEEEERRQNEKREDAETPEKSQQTHSLNKINKDGLKEFNMKAYISTLLSNKDGEVYTQSFIQNLQVNYEQLSVKHVDIKDAYDFYSRNIPPTEKKKDSYYSEELNAEEITRAKYLIEELDYSLRNNVKSIYSSFKGEKGDSCYLSKYGIFKQLDVDKDSYITEEDLRKCVKNLKIKDMQDSDVNLLLKYMDPEKKGYVNVNDFLENYNLEEKSMRKWIRQGNQPYYDYIKRLQNEAGSRKRCVSSHETTEHNKIVMNVKKYEDVINNYNLELDPCCPSYVLRERIRENFMARKEDFVNKHLKATRFHITGYKNTNDLTEPVKDSALYIDDASRFKTTYEMNYT